MKLDLRTMLKNPGEAFEFSFEETWSPLSAEGEELEFIEPVRLAGEAVSFDSNVSVKGRVVTRLKTSCARCLASIEFAVDTRLDEVLFKEQDEEAPYERLYSGDSVMLDEMVEEAVRLSFPMRFLCEKGCKGLCPDCGANLNQTTCPHAAQVLGRR